MYHIHTHDTIFINVINGSRGIAPTRNCTHFLKSVLNIFLCIKLNFFSYNYVSFIFLNTLMVKPLIFVFGIDELVVRMPNILSFLLYAFGAYRIIISVLGKTSLFFIPASILFVMNPYLLDFFGLCRGYGVSIGFVTLSLSYLITSFKFSNSRHLWFALIFSCFASYANFTSLIFWASVCLFVLLYYVINRKGENPLSNGKFALMILLGLGYAVLILNPILKMQNDDQFRFWTSNGFAEETVKSLVHNGVYGSRIFLTVNFISYFCMINFALHLIPHLQ